MNLFVKAWLVGYLRPTSNLLKVRAGCQRWQALVLAEGRGGLALEKRGAGICNSMQSLTPRRTGGQCKGASWEPVRCEFLRVKRMSAEEDKAF